MRPRSPETAGQRTSPGARLSGIPGSPHPSLWGPGQPLSSHLRGLAFPPRWRSGFGPSAWRNWRKEPPSSPIKWTSRYEGLWLGPAGQGTGLFLPHGDRQVPGHLVVTGRAPVARCTILLLPIELLANTELATSSRKQGSFSRKPS